jgi:hypothetical protein
VVDSAWILKHARRQDELLFMLVDTGSREGLECNIKTEGTLNRAGNFLFFNLFLKQSGHRVPCLEYPHRFSLNLTHSNSDSSFEEPSN